MRLHATGNSITEPLTNDRNTARHRNFERLLDVIKGSLSGDEKRADGANSSSQGTMRFRTGQIPVWSSAMPAPLSLRIKGRYMARRARLWLPGVRVSRREHGE